MTDEQIIKALPMVAYGGHFCNKCKYKYEKGECRCGLKGCRITRNALALINRKDAEIERLNAVSEICGDCHRQYAEKIERAKSEAIKEFAKKYKEHIKNFTGRFTDGMGFMVNLDAILFAVDFVADNLLKEMTNPVKVEHNSLCETETYKGE